MTATKIGTLRDRIANRLVRHLPWPKFAIETDVPIVSFTFDDAPREAGTIGASILEEYEARGTFYIAGQLADEEPETFLSAQECKVLAQRGHEIAAHTYAHQKIGVFSKSTLADDFDRNDAFLGEIVGHQPRRNFAFPYGMACPLHHRGLAKRFRTARSVNPGVNRGMTDLSYIAGVELRPDPAFLEIAQAALDDVLHNPGWLVFFTHDVSDHPSTYGCHQSVFRSLVARARDNGAKIMTVEAAADKLKLPA